MRTMKVWFAMVMCMFAAAGVQALPKPLIQAAILLDTSNSMDGLIDQARTQLWRIVNELAAAKKRGVTPDLYVALYEYGNAGLSADRGYIRRVLPLTTDLDRVSEELFALRTNGGDEYCGQVIREAVKELEWSPSPDVMKLIFIAGNEPFTQGYVDFHESCRKAMARGIMVNTIFCGNPEEGIRTSWKSGADLADGSYMSIDQNAVIAEITAPQDKDIASLGEELNGTYIAYGRYGKAGADRQSAQDANVANFSSVNSLRQVAKSQAIYSNSTWDLVDANKNNVIDLETMKVQDLPPEMQKMTPGERKAYVAGMEKKRADIQARILALNEARKKYVAAVMRNRPPAASTLDSAVIAIVHVAGAKKGYTFP